MSTSRSLANEVGRRLDSFSETVHLEERVAAVDVFHQDLINSGHSLSTTRGILVSGITDHVRKVGRCREKRTPLHRSARQSLGSRRTKKPLAKTQRIISTGKEEEDGEMATTPAPYGRVADSMRL